MLTRLVTVVADSAPRPVLGLPWRELRELCRACGGQRRYAARMALLARLCALLCITVSASAARLTLGDPLDVRSVCDLHCVSS
jgi:hypothetical protein